MKYCLIVPHYKHEALFSKYLPKLAELNIPCIVVDDGSGEESLDKLEKALFPFEHFTLIKHHQNRGKGASVITACYYATTQGFTHAIQVDADGQHNINDVEKLIKYSQIHSGAIISGKPFFDESAPKVRVYGRKITDFWVAVETLSFKIKDSLCGFRIYPLAEFGAILDRYYIGARMDFDTEILVKAMWANIDVHFIPTKVIYHEETVSHFHYLRDNSLLIKLHIRLMFGMLIRLPNLLLYKIKALLGN